LKIKNKIEKFLMDSCPLLLDDEYWKTYGRKKKTIQLKRNSRKHGTDSEDEDSE
jgi:hypothetical protein